MKLHELSLVVAAFLAIIAGASAYIHPTPRETSKVLELSNRPKLSLIKYKKYLKKEGENKKRLMKLAELERKAGFISAAIATYDKITEKYGPDREVAGEQIKLARISFQGKHLIDHLEKIYQKQGEKESLIDLVQLYSSFNRLDKEEWALQELIKLEPSQSLHYLLLNNVYQNTGDTDAQLANYELMKKNKAFPGSEKERNQLLLEIAYLYGRQGKTKQQTALYRELIDLNPKSRKFVNMFLDFYSFQGKTGEQIKLLLEAIERFPGSQNFLDKLINIYSAEHKSEEIERFLKGKIKKYPQEKLYYHKLAALYRWTGDHQSIIDTYKLMEKNGAFPAREEERNKLLLEMADLYGMLKKEERQIATYKRLISLYPENTGFIDALLDIYSYYGRIEEQIALLQQTIEKLRGHDKYVTNLVNIYNARKNFRKSENLLGRLALQHRPGRKYYRQLIDLYSYTGKYRKSVNLLQRLIKEDPSYYFYYGQLLKLLAGRGNIKEEIKVYRAILGKFPKRSVQARLRLTKLYLATFQLEKAAEIYLEDYRQDRNRLAPLLSLADLALWKKKSGLAVNILLKARKIHGHEYELEMKLADIYLQRKENGKVVMVYRNLHEQEKLTLKDKLKLLKYYLWFGRVDDFYKWGMSLPLDKIPLRSLVTLYQVALSRNDYEGAVRLLTQREKSGENPDSILIQRYQMENKFGNIDRSIALAERIYAGNSSEKNFKELVSLYTAEQDYGKLNDLEEKHFLKYPNDAHLAEELYNLYLWNKDLGRGIKYFRSVTKLYPDNPPVSTYLGSLYYLRKEFDKAEIYYSRVEMEEMDDDNLDQLAHVYEMRKKWSKALAALKILYKRSPKPETILNLARVKIELNDFPGALADYKSFLTSHENDFKIRMEYLAVLEDFGERKEVIDQMEKLKRKKMTFFQLRTYAEYAFEMNLYQYARWAYLKILKAHPDSRKAVFRLGLMANWEDNFPEAARYYRLYLSRFPAHPDVLYNLAEIRLTEGKKSLAESLYKKVEKLLLQQQNRNLSQQLLLNKTLIRLGKRLKAIENYQRLFVKYPDKIDVLVDYLELLIDTKSFHEALLVFSKISSLSPGDDLRLLKLRVRLYQDMGNHALAIRILLKAENRYPDKVWIKTSMATNYQMLGRDISSLYYLQTAQWLYPTDNYYLIQDKMDILKTFTDSFSEKVSLLERNNSERRLHLVSTWKTYATDRWFVNASHNREWSRRGKLKGADPAKATSITADIFDLSAHFQQDSYSDYYGGIVNKYGTGGYLGSKFRWKNEQLELRLGYREPWNDFYEIRYRRGEKSTLFSGITGGLPSLSRVLRGESYYNITAFYQEFFLKDQSGSAANKKSRNPFGSARGGSLSLGHNLGNHPIVSVAGNFDWFYASLNNTALVPVATRRAALGTSVNISDQLLSFWGYSIGGGYENNLEMMVNAGYYSLEIYYRPRPNFEFKLGYRKEKSLLTTVYGIVDQYFVNLSVLY